MSKLLLLLIKLYQFFLSPWLGKNCRFYPTCSEYAKESLVTHGVPKGLYLTLRRISKCHPFNKGGYDPVKKN